MFYDVIILPEKIIKLDDGKKTVFCKGRLPDRLMGVLKSCRIYISSSKKKLNKPVTEPACPELVFRGILEESRSRKCICKGCKYFNLLIFLQTLTAPRLISFIQFVCHGRIHFMKRWQFWLGILISVVFMYFALQGLHLADVWDQLKNASYIWILPGIAVYFIGVWIRAWRWHYLLRPIKKIPVRTMFPIVTIGYMGNNIYPARAGEVLRAVVLKRREGVPVSASLATIIVERVFDGVVMLAFVFLNLPELAKLTQDSGFVGDIQTLALWGTAAFVGALLVFLLAAMFPVTAENWITKFINIFVPQKLREKLLPLVNKFMTGLESLRSPKDALMIFFTSAIIWLLETGKYWFVMHAFNFEVSFFALMLMNGIVNLATTIPSAPGYVGTFDAPGIALLTAYNIPKEIATGYTLVLHVALWLPITALGAYYFTREGLKWGEKLEVESN